MHARPIHGVYSLVKANQYWYSTQIEHGTTYPYQLHLLWTTQTAAAQQAAPAYSRHDDIFADECT